VKDVCGGNKRLPGVLVANKMDQVGVDGEGQAVDEARARKFAENQGLEFFACSAVRFPALLPGLSASLTYSWLSSMIISRRRNTSSVINRSTGWPTTSSLHT
jgi:hypothetical protein